MEKKNFKRLIYVLSLSSVMSLTSCGSNQKVVEEPIIKISDDNIDEENIKDKIISENKCSNNHINESVLNIDTLDNGKEYINDANVKLAIRDKFLNINMIASQNSIDNARINEIIDSTEYLYLFNNDLIRSNIQNYISNGDIVFNHKLTNEEILNLMQYKEDKIEKKAQFGLAFDDNDTTYEFYVNSSLASYETVKESVSTNEITYTKKCTIYNINVDDYYMDNNYTLSNTLNSNISIFLNTSYDLNMNDLINKNYSCDNFKSSLILNNAEDKIEVVLTEEQFNNVNNLLFLSVTENNTVEQFLKNNDELLNNIYGESYKAFIEKNEKVLTLKK